MSMEKTPCGNGAEGTAKATPAAAKPKTRAARPAAKAAAKTAAAPKPDAETTPVAAEAKVSG